MQTHVIIITIELKITCPNIITKLCDDKIQIYEL